MATQAFLPSLPFLSRHNLDPKCTSEQCSNFSSPAGSLISHHPELKQTRTKSKKTQMATLCSDGSFGDTCEDKENNRTGVNCGDIMQPVSKQSVTVGIDNRGPETRASSGSKQKVKAVRARLEAESKQKEQKRKKVLLGEKAYIPFDLPTLHSVIAGKLIF